MKNPDLHFIHRGQVVTLHKVPPQRTLLEVLREDLNCTSAKEGCGEGDCGACTVVLGQASGEGLRVQAINSCIRLAHSVQGMTVWTAQDLPAADGTLHPCQQAMLDCHGSQCGFCTPGFVMSLFGMYQNRVLRGEPISREIAQADLSGNLCRCTGYRPILDAAQTMGHLPQVALDESDVLLKMKQLDEAVQGENANSTDEVSYLAPTTLAGLLAARAAYPQAQVVAGCTDVGLWVTKQHRQFERVLDVTRAAELRRMEISDSLLVIGASVTLHEAYAALVAQWPQLQRFAERFAGLPVRHSGTLGGNVANGSPIGDSMPLLIALQARVVLASVRGERSLPLEALYTGYRTHVMAPDELLVRIEVPKALAADQLRVYKISKRQDDDISAVCLALRLRLQDGVICSASIGVGGVAATPVRAIKTEAALQGVAWGKTAFEHAAAVLQAEFQPISDMRASAAYRTELMGSLLHRFWADVNGEPVSLDTLEVLA